jgi:hypothetical protein
VSSSRRRDGTIRRPLASIVCRNSPVNDTNLPYSHLPAGGRGVSGRHNSPFYSTFLHLAAQSDHRAPACQRLGAQLHFCNLLLLLLLLISELACVCLQGRNADGGRGSGRPASKPRANADCSGVGQAKRTASLSGRLRYGVQAGSRRSAATMIHTLSCGARGA